MQNTIYCHDVVKTLYKTIRKEIKVIKEVTCINKLSDIVESLRSCNLILPNEEMYKIKIARNKIKMVLKLLDTLKVDIHFRNSKFEQIVKQWSF